jgi:hypothetical protein
MAKTIDDYNYTTTAEQGVYIPLDAHEAPLYEDSPPTVHPNNVDYNNNNNKADDNDVTSGSGNAAHHGTRTTVTTTTTTTYIPPPPISKPNLVEMKRNRIKAQTLAGWIGGAVGCLVLFIPGAIIGAIAGNKITKHVMKQEERKAQEDYEYRMAQLNAIRESSNYHATKLQQL